MKNGIIDRVLLVPGHPQILLAPEKNQGWKKLNQAYKNLAAEIAQSDADIILYFSTQWLSVLGYTVQADPHPEWTHVDHNFHELGSMKYKFKVDPSFAQIYAEEIKAEGHFVRSVNYRGFPIDTGTIVAQKLLNPENKIPAAMVSCNMYAEKNETQSVGFAAARALEKSGKKAIAVLVSSLSNRYFIKDINPAEDHISSAKDHEWNLKIYELLGQGRLEDVAQVAREFGREANGDMGFKGIWWLSALCGNTNNFTGKNLAYEAVLGTGAALVEMVPTKAVFSKAKPTSKPAIAQSENSEVVQSEQAPEPVGAYPHARKVGDLVFLSGVGPRAKGKKEIPGVTLAPNGSILQYDIEVQTKSVIENVKTILASAGSSLEKIIDVQVYLTNMKEDFPKFNKIYAEYFSSIQATRTTIEVGSLPTPIAVEFKVVAKA